MTPSRPAECIEFSGYGSVDDLCGVPEDVRSSLMSWLELSERCKVGLCAV